MTHNAIATGTETTESAYWILYDSKTSETPIHLSERSIRRRQLKSGMELDCWYDYPVDNDNIRAVQQAGGKIRHISRWLNAVSIMASEEIAVEISRLPGVRNIRRVSSHKFPRILDNPIIKSPATVSLFDYGPSFNQISMLAVDSLHNLGYSGAGVLVGILDTGFDYSHICFSDIVSDNRIIATYDFINGDTNVTDGEDVQRNHGTQVFSVLAGFEEGSLIGPAFGAEFVLAKTEIEFQEIQAEEDNWVAAAEWMDSIGVDIISSSVGYLDWYDTTQLDGQTALCTRAANIAVSLGIVVVNSAGNEGNTFWRKVMPPADGDSVIAAGGVNPSGLILANSSRGPTADGRIKPDFCAQGSSVYAANWHGGYLPVGGTSYAAPLLAGSIALLMEAHPSWRVADVFENMKSYSLRPPVFNHTGPQSVILGETLNLRISVDFLPDNNYGWGIPDFNEVVNLPGDWYGDDVVMEAVDLPPNGFFEDSMNGSGLFSFSPDQTQAGEDMAVFVTSLEVVYADTVRIVYSDTEMVRILILDELSSLSALVAPHPAVDSAVFRIQPNDLGTGHLYIHDVSGAVVKEFEFESVDGNFIRMVWDGKNSSGKYVASGVYILNVSMGGSTVTEKFFLVSSR